jgi:uncharacterized membrane protein
LPTASAPAVGSSGSAARAGGIQASSRYTPPVPKHFHESPRWLPILMIILFAVGAILILTRYLFETPQWMVFAGLGFIMGGLYTATKWR